MKSERYLLFFKTHISQILFLVMSVVLFLGSSFIGIKTLINIPSLLSELEEKQVKTDQIYEKIKKLLLDGWQPIGGIAVERFSGYYQAMVKYEEEENE